MLKIKSFIKKHGKKLSISATAAMMAVLACISSFAAEGETAVGTSDLQSAFSSAVSNVQGDILGYLGIALPVGLAIFGAIIAIKKGISFVRGLIGR